MEDTLVGNTLLNGSQIEVWTYTPDFIFEDASQPCWSDLTTELNYILLCFV